MCSCVSVCSIGYNPYITMYKFLCGLIYAFLLTGITYAEPTRKVSDPAVNQGCEPADVCSEPWILNVTSAGKNNTLHYLWGAVGAPTFITAVTEKDTSLMIDWENFTNHYAGAITFSDFSDVHYVFGFTVPEIILFNDVGDTGKIDSIPEEDRRHIPMTDFTWKIKEVINSSAYRSGVIFETESFRNETLSDDAKISVQVLAFGEEGRSFMIPHLITTPDSAQFDIIIDNLILNISKFDNESDIVAPLADFTHPRWALELVVFSSEMRDDIKEGFKYATHKSLDDENTPGVFNIDDITTNRSRTDGGGGYLQWRPVVYLSPDRDIKYSSYPNINTSFAELDELSDATKKSLAFALLGESLDRLLVSTKTVIAFGQQKDGFYTKFNYTTWTLTYGIGSPPAENFSTLVIIIISLGVGIPTVVFLMGGTFICCRKFRGQ